MDVKNFVKILGADYFTGVPDSQLKALCNYLMQQYGVDAKHHVIGANEGNCVGDGCRLLMRVVFTAGLLFLLTIVIVSFVTGSG